MCHELSACWQDGGNDARSVPHTVAFLSMAQIQNPGQPGCVGIHMALASYYTKMKDLTKAEEYLANALKLDPKNNEVLWLQAKVRKDKNLQQQTQKCKDKFDPPKQGKLKMKEPLKVVRCNLSDLTPKQFLFEYGMTATPVIVTGIQMTNNPWDIQHVTQVMGHTTTKKLPTEGTQLSDPLIDSLHGDKKTCCSSEWSLNSAGSELTQDLVIPRYVANDFLQRTSSRENWPPCLSIEPSGTTTTIHLEPLGFNCWMGLLQGRKRLTLVRREEIPCLYPYCDDNLNVVFYANLSNPDLKDFPLLSTITPLECILGPGDLLLIPGGTAYCEETLDDSLTISGPHVDLSNLHSTIEELDTVKLSDPKAQQLYEQLSSKTFPTKMWSNQNDLKWEEFLKWPRESYQEFDITLSDCP